MNEYPVKSADLEVPVGIPPRRSGRGAITQPLEVALIPDALLKIPTAAPLIGVSTSTINRLIKRGELTAVKRGSRCTRLRSKEVMGLCRTSGNAE